MNGQKLNQIRKKANKDAKKLHEFVVTLSKLYDFSNKEVNYKEILTSLCYMMTIRQKKLQLLPELKVAIDNIYSRSIFELYDLVDNIKINKKNEEEIEYLKSLLMHEWVNTNYYLYEDEKE